MVDWLVDTNVWLALLEEQHALHGTAISWWQNLEEDDRVLFCRSAQQSFLRLRTTDAVARAYKLKPGSNTTALRTYATLFKDERVELIDEPTELERKWIELASVRTASPKLWMVAYVAAFAITGNYRLVTTDKAFMQFKGVELVVLG